METTTVVQSPDVCIQKEEVFDVDMAQWILNNKDISKDERDAVRRLLKSRVNGNKHITDYKLGKDIKNEMLGRFCAVKGEGLQCLSRECRNALAGKYYWDIDIRNAQPTLLQQYAEKRGWVCSALTRYNQHRDEYIQELMDELQIQRWEAKERVCRVLFGGGASGMTPFFVRELEPEVRNLMVSIFNENRVKHPSVAKRNNSTRAMMAFILQTEERECLLAIDKSLAERGRSLDVLIHDGGLVRKKDGEACFPEELLRKVETDVKKRTGYDISLAVKPMITSLERDDEEVLLDADVLVDDAYAGRTFVKLMEGKIVLDSGVVYVFDDTKGIWTDKEQVIHRKMVDFGEKLVFRQQGPLGIVKIFNYSGDVAHQDRLRRCLPSVLVDRSGYFKDRIETSIDKLLFTDGIYDFKTKTFSAGFDPEIVFFGGVPRPFPVNVDKKAMEFVRQKFFRDPFKNPAVGDTLLHYLARGLAGHYKAKKAVIAYGPENSTKGTLANHLETTLGPSLVGTFAGDSLLVRTGDAEAAKANSWIRKICDTRVSYSSEITVAKEKPKPINGNLLKSLSGGGDTITLRTNYKDEEQHVNKSLCFLFCNDLPDISPVDGSIRDRLVTIPYTYAFVDEPTLPFHKKRDHDVGDQMKNDTHRDATVALLLEAMETWDRKPYVLPEECKALKDDLAPMANIQELLTEEYDITGDEADWVPTEELIQYLRSRRVDGSDRKIGDKLTQVGLGNSTKREGRKIFRVRVGIRRA